MMRSEIPCAAISDHGLIAVGIPFLQYGFRFVAVMADDDHGFSDVLARLHESQLADARAVESGASQAGSGEHAEADDTRPARWEKLLADFERFGASKIPLTMPKMRMQVTTDLEPLLNDLGVRKVFRPDAEFLGTQGGMAAKIPFFVTQARQEVFIEVNEKGAEAAGASSVSIGCSARIPDGTPLAFDRPFIFAIQDTRTGAVIVCGQVVDPSLFEKE